MALMESEGFSEAIENKNRIRRVLVTFFQNRDCCVLVRPTKKENKLNNLNEIPLESLRAEFQQGVTNIRRKILTNMKPKTIHGKNINGQILAGLINAYVSAINQNEIPDVDNAWETICKFENDKAIKTSLLV
jgi:hypothetical protein